MIRYMECQRNHAAHLGCHVVDGCGEFMSSGEDVTPLALKCAACECHRNFHRREIATTAPPPATANCCYISFNRPKPQKHQPLRHHHNHQARMPVMMAFGGGAPAESSSEDLKAAAAAAARQQYGVSKKRFRTKFTEKQKEKMREFAEKIEWRMQKQDDGEVQRFCGEVGVKRHVFKVWLHNNKQSIIKRKHS